MRGPNPLKAVALLALFVVCRASWIVTVALVVSGFSRTVIQTIVMSGFSWIVSLLWHSSSAASMTANTSWRSRRDLVHPRQC